MNENEVIEKLEEIQQYLTKVLMKNTFNLRLFDSYIITANEDIMKAKKILIEETETK